MEEKERHTKADWLAFTTTALFIPAGCIGIGSWLALLLPVSVAFYVYDRKQGGIYEKSMPAIPADYAVYLICAVELIACIFSIYRPNSVAALLRVLLLAAFYFFVRRYLRFDSQFRMLCTGMAATAGVLSLVTLFFFAIHRTEFYSVGFTDLTFFRQYYRPWGQLSNDWATVLLGLLPFSFIALSGSRGKRKCLFMGTALLNTAAVLASFSRGAYIALGVFFVSAVFLTFLFDRANLKRTGIMAAAIWGISLVCLYPEKAAVLTTCSLFKTVSQQRSIEGRLLKWQEAAHLFRLFPVTGTGGGNYALASDIYPAEREGLFTPRSTNTYLQLAAEKGITGIVAYGFLLWCVCMAGWKRVARGDRTALFVFSALLALGIREGTFSSFFEKDCLAVITVLSVCMLVQPVKNDVYGLFRKPE